MLLSGVESAIIMEVLQKEKRMLLWICVCLCVRVLCVIWSLPVGLFLVEATAASDSVRPRLTGHTAPSFTTANQHVSKVWKLTKIVNMSASSKTSTSVCVCVCSYLGADGSRSQTKGGCPVWNWGQPEWHQLLKLEVISNPLPHQLWVGPDTRHHSCR